MTSFGMDMGNSDWTRGAGKKDALVSLDLLRPLDLVQSNCIKGNMGSQYLVEIALEFKAYAGIDADDEHMVFWLASVHVLSSCVLLG